MPDTNKVAAEESRAHADCFPATKPKPRWLCGVLLCGMSEGPWTLQMDRGVQRPLLGLLGACLVGGLLGELEGPLPLIISLAAWGAWTCLRRVRQAQVQGLDFVLLLLLASLAGLRSAGLRPAGLRPAGQPTYGVLVHRGLWHTLHEGRELLGELEGQSARYELPAGSVRDGEQVELLPSRVPLPPARALLDGPAEPSLPVLYKLYADEIRRLAPAPQAQFWMGRLAWRKLRRKVLKRLEHIDDSGARALARALLFGDRGELDPATTDLFTRTGTRHALAVSGLHVGLVASLWIWPLGSLLAWLLGRLSFLPKALLRWMRPELMRIGLLLSFIPLAGAGAPVIRAALALGLMQAAELLPARGALRWKRQPDSLSLWAFAALLEWSANPAGLSSISMQLSYVATLGLILLTRPIDSWLRRGLPARGKICEVWRSGHRRPAWLRIVGQKAIDWTVTGLAASCAASLATLPLVWQTFGEWSLAGPCATLFLLPLLASFLGLAWLELIWPVAPIEWGLAAIASAMHDGLTFFDTWPGTPIPLPLRPAALLWVAGLSLLLTASARGIWRSVARRVCLFCWGLAILPWWNGVTSPELYLADVGHGTAAILRLPGAGTWLFDAGSRDRRGVARQALAPLLRKLDVGPVHVVLSHTDVDHAGALPWLIERFVPSTWMGAIPAHLKERLPHTTPTLDLPSGRLEIELGSEGARFALALLRGQPGSGNEGSRSLEVCWGSQRWLLCGDAEGPGLARQLRSEAIRGPYDLLLFPHHGSQTPWLAELLEAAQPREVWFSASGRPPVADELDRRKIPWRCTSIEGPMHRGG